MRRRDRFNGVAWLRRFISQGGDGRTATRPPAIAESAAAMLREIGQAGYLVEMERDAGAYRVRCLPLRDRLTTSQPPVALSYSGVDLSSILASAAYEIRQLRSLAQDYEPSGQEVVRWVP